MYLLKIVPSCALSKILTAFSMNYFQALAVISDGIGSMIDILEIDIHHKISLGALTLIQQPPIN